MTCEDLNTFKPLRIIINGQGGSGKSVVIKTLYSISYKIFGLIAYSLMNAPTGGYVYNANGKTCHQHWAITRNPKSLQISSEEKISCVYATLS